MAMLDINGLSISFGGLHAVDDFNVTIEEGQLYGLIGPNGAGKTTVFNLLTGVYKPTEGVIRLNGQDITGKSTVEINRAGVARTFQNIRLFKEMPVLDNVKVGFHNQHQYSTLTGILRLPKYWKVEAEISSDKLIESGEKRGMIIDFSDLKKAVRTLADSFDHTLIYEQGTLRSETVDCLKTEGFSLKAVDFRPTAENFARHFCEVLTGRGLLVKRVCVYETPENCAAYEVDV